MFETHIYAHLLIGQTIEHTWFLRQRVKSNCQGQIGLSYSVVSLSVHALKERLERD